MRSQIILLDLFLSWICCGGHCKLVDVVEVACKSVVLLHVVKDADYVLEGTTYASVINARSHLKCRVVMLNIRRLY